MRGWTVFCTEDPASVLEEMRSSGFVGLHDHVVAFLHGGLAVEGGAAVDAGGEPPGEPMGDGSYNLGIPDCSVLVSYAQFPGLREFRVTGLIWVD